MKINKTIIISRHSLRKPLFEFIEFKNDLNYNHWKKWSKDDSELTEKGIRVENQLSKELTKYLPDTSIKREIFITDTTRTKETAEIILQNLLSEKINGNDYVDMTQFYHTKQLNDAEKQQLINKYMHHYHKIYENTNLKESNENILNILFNRNTTLSFDENELTIDVYDNMYPRFRGRQSMLFQLADIIYSEYYDGYTSIEDVEKVQRTKITHLDLIARIEELAPITSMKLNENILNFFNQNEKNLQIYVCHDINLLGIIASLRISKELPDTVEPAPIGGKLVLTETSIANQEYITITYVYMDSINFEKIHNIEIYSETKEKFEKHIKQVINKGKII